ncbi:MAG: type II toxin-antitoxin system HicB family antitoxin [Methanoregula sp.]|jgi:predicted RNase H-like HicB family nuclease
MIMHYTIILDAQADGGYTARCVELSEALGRGSTQGEALASIRESIELEQAARCEVLHKTMGAVNSEIIRIEVADTA